MPSDGANDNFELMLRWGAIITGLIMAVPVVIVLATQSPPLLATLLVLGFLGWAGVRSGVLARDDEATTTDTDPLTTLQDRYAAGEISEAEFERRVERIIESDEQLRSAGADRTIGEGFDTTTDDTTRTDDDRLLERE